MRGPACWIVQVLEQERHEVELRERIAARGARDQAGHEQVVQRAQRAGGIGLGREQRLALVEREPQVRRERERMGEALAVGAQGGHARAVRLRDARGQVTRVEAGRQRPRAALVADGAAVDQVLRERHRVAGVASRDREHLTRQQRQVRHLSEHRTEQLCGLALVEVREREARAVFSEHLHRTALVRAVAGGREQRDGMLRDLGRKQRHERRARLVDRVRVVDGDQQRPVLAHRGEPLAQRLLHARPLLLRVLDHLERGAG